MASAGVDGFGVILKVNTVAIAEVFEVAIPGLERDEIELTSHDSPNQYREWMAGLKDAGELEVSYNLVQGNSSQSALLTLFESGAIAAIEMTLPTTVPIVIAFSGFVKAWGGETPLDDRIIGQVTLRLTGKPTVTSL